MSTITLRSLRSSGIHHNLSTSIRPTLQSQSSLDFLLPSISILSTQIARPRRRHASTSPASSSPPRSVLPHTDTLNAPISTLPAPIDPPTQAPGQSKIKYLYTLGKTYVSFYKTGLVNIKNNFVAARPLLDIISKNHNGSLFTAAHAQALTRSDFQLLRRNAHDVKRVPMFALVMLICGEFTPLVVIAVSNVVPWTCRIPRQIGQDRKKLEERRAISFRNLTLPPVDEGGVDKLARMQALHISWSLGLSSRIWDWLGGQLPGLPTGILKKRVAKRVEYLTIDDDLIKTHGGVSKLSTEELKLACVDRGIDILDRSERDIRHDLTAWTESASKVPIERLLLTRPSAWPSKGAARPVKAE